MHKNDFIMKPKVDFCFKELMTDDEVRRGFISAVLNWAQFFNSETREELEMFAKSDDYVQKAYDKLVNISADEQKRLEYEEREKALRDRSIIIISGREQGMEQGRTMGRMEGLKLARDILRLHKSGVAPDKIADECGISVEQVKDLLG